MTNEIREALLKEIDEKKLLRYCADQMEDPLSRPFWERVRLWVHEGSPTYTELLHIILAAQDGKFKRENP
jgi:hypothetical protein